MATVRRLEYSDPKSKKFWEVSVSGKAVTVRYGRIGADGRAQTKAYGSLAAAMAAAEKQIAEKLKKGYREIRGSRTKRVAPLKKSSSTSAKSKKAKTKRAAVKTPAKKKPRQASGRGARRKEVQVVGPNGAQYSTPDLQRFEQEHNCVVLSEEPAAPFGVASDFKGVDEMGRGYRLSLVPYFSATFHGSLYDNIISLRKWADYVGISQRQLSTYIKSPLTYEREVTVDWIVPRD
jgi:predicted DNA-binding WGR domain protein